MGRSLPLLIAASLSLFTAPALAEEEPPPATSMPPPPSYDAPAPGGALAPVPEGYGPRPMRSESLRTGMMATGIVLVGLGVTAMTVGTVAYASRIDTCPIPSQPRDDAPDFRRCPEDPIQFIGTTIVVAGGIVTALGIPLWIFGSSSAPVGPEPRTATVPTLLVGPRSAALRFTF